MEDVRRAPARPPTLAHLFWARAEATPDGVAFTYPVAGSWQSSTWGECRDLVAPLAAGLVDLGVGPEDPVALISETRVEWILADLAIGCAGGTVVPVDPASRPEDVVHVLNDSGAEVVVVSSLAQVETLRRVRGRIRGVRKVVLVDGAYADRRVMTLEQLHQRGTEVLADRPDLVTRRMAALRDDMLATIMYTAGATGQPRGVRLTHAAWTYEGTTIAAEGVLGPEDLQLLWLPLAHGFGRLLLAAQLACGFTSAIDGDPDRVAENLATVRPTFMAAPPRVFADLHAAAAAVQDGEGAVRRRALEQAFAVARKRRTHLAAGRRVPYLLARRHEALDKLVMARIRARFGGRLRFLISGSAALDADVADFFDLAGVTVLEGYGLTEACAASVVNRPWANRPGTVGTPLPGTEVRIADDGEVLLRGPGVMAGYHRLPAETAAVLRHGWLSTGDVGTLDAEGRLTITGRKKELFKTSGGRYVAPAHLEHRLRSACPAIGDVVVVGSDRPHCVALVTLDPVGARRWAAAAIPGVADLGEIARHPETRLMLRDHLGRLNATTNPWEGVRDVAVLEDSPVLARDAGLSWRERRTAVETVHAAEIAALYPDEGSARHGDFEVTDAELAAPLVG